MLENDAINNQAFQIFVEEIKQKIKTAQYHALQAVNKEQITLYWEIGKLIVERQMQYGWGKSIVESLAKELQWTFPNASGFSVQNLWYMRQLFVEYSPSKLLQPMVGEINWSKQLIIMSKCKDKHQRFFYIEMTHRHAWSLPKKISQFFPSRQEFIDRIESITIALKNKNK